jgi:exoribonuclease II
MTMLSDDERAKQVVLDVDTTYSYAQIPDALRPILEQAIIKAFAAIREECAKLAEPEALTPDHLKQAVRKIVERDKQLGPDRIYVPGLGRLTESPEGEWTDE